MSGGVQKQMIQNKIMAFCIPKPDFDLVKAISSARGEQPSDFIRRAIKKELASFGHLNPTDWRALGIIHGGKNGT